MSFEMGTVVQTAGIAAAIEEDFQLGIQITVALDRFARGDWGDVPDEDWGTNEVALEGGDRLMGAYPTDAGRIWIITEADRSATTILFPEEY